MNVTLTDLNFAVSAKGTRIRVIETMADQIVTNMKAVDAPITGNEVVSDPDQDLLKIAVIERHHGTGRTGIGFVRGFGLQRGAIGATVAHDAHNIILIGTRDEDMRVAAQQLITMGGGLVVVDNMHITASLALPIAGLMSDQPFAVVAECYRELLDAVRILGSKITDPFITMSFLALSVIPEIKITDKGLVDVKKFEIVPLFAD